MTPKYQLSVVVKYSKNCNLCLPPYKHFYSRSEEVTGIKINDEGRNEMQMIDYRKSKPDNTKRLSTSECHFTVTKCTNLAFIILFPHL